MYTNQSAKAHDSYNSKPKRAVPTYSNLNRREIRELRGKLKKQKNFEGLEHFNEQIKNK